MAGAVHDNTEHHRFELNEGGVLTFSAYRRHDGVVTFVHTVVPPEAAGHGTGSALIRGALDLVRVAGEKVIAECSFVARFIEKHPEYRDLLYDTQQAKQGALDAQLDEALRESFPASDPPAVTPRR